MRRLTLPSVLLVGTLAALLTGCSQNPVAPVSTPMNGGGQPLVGTQTDDVPSTIEGGEPHESTGVFDGGGEGTLTVGRFTLQLHKNTLQMPATITMRIAEDDAMEVEIEVSPAEANDFQVPAQLIANMSDKPDTDFRGLTMFYWENAGWDETHSVGHSNQQTLVAHMKHLSACRVAEAANTGETAKQK